MKNLDRIKIHQHQRTINIKYFQFLINFSRGYQACFSIDVSILLLVIRTINTQRGKDSFDHTVISVDYPVFDWYSSSVYVSKKLRLSNFIMRSFGVFLSIHLYISFKGGLTCSS